MEMDDTRWYQGLCNKDIHGLRIAAQDQGLSRQVMVDAFRQPTDDDDDDNDDDDEWVASDADVAVLLQELW